jgi:hypothetical protein
MSEDRIERLAEYAHDAWSGWMKYLFSKSTSNEDGTVTIPKWAVNRWSRQASTKYSGLLEDEKESDRAEARRIIQAINIDALLRVVEVARTRVTDCDDRRRLDDALAALDLKDGE